MDDCAKTIWGDVPTWLAAIGTCGAVIVSLWLTKQSDMRMERKERRRQAELVTAWLGPEQPVGNGLLQTIVIQNSSAQSIYLMIASLVSIQGAFRETAVGDSRGYCSTVGQIPPGTHTTSIKSGGHGMNKKFGVELAFQDATGVFWLRHGDGRLEEVKEDPVTLYKMTRPVGWEVG
jgi:hypothetical protein